MVSTFSVLANIKNLNEKEMNVPSASPLFVKKRLRKCHFTAKVAEVALAFALPAFTSTVRRHCPAFFSTRLDFFTEQIFDEAPDIRTDTTEPLGVATPNICAAVTKSSV